MRTDGVGEIEQIGSPLRHQRQLHFAATQPREQVAAKSTLARQALEIGECTRGVSSLMLPYISAGGDHGFYVPDPNLAFDINTFMINTIGRYFQTQGRIIDYRPCLEDNSCEHIPAFPYGPDWP